ncbi:helix-turn-helix transcriptional regulator [Actinotalea sp.]|uniref:helix-turn-helix transcriptional regulator n=1 Tax=Actinotalea sp. TaxID=1872145 RepID=UPI003569D0B7
MVRWDEHQALASPSRVAILELLRARGEAVGVDEISREVGLHVNTAREHLDRLVTVGFVTREREHRTVRGRPKMLYRSAVPVEDGPQTVRARLDAVLVAGYGQAAESPADAARAAGRALVEGLPPLVGAAAQDAPSQLGALVDHLEGLGFSTETSGYDIHLEQCPLAHLAQSRSEVVCSAHLGMTSALAERLGGPLEVEGVDPFSSVSGACVLHLREA